MSPHPFVFPRRNLIAIAAVLAGAACGGEDAALSERAVVITPTDTLTAEALRDILLMAPTLPAQEAAIGTVSIWTDLAVVVAAVADGGSLNDDATVAAAIRPVAMEMTIQRYAQGRAGSVTPTRAQVDSIARGNLIRVFRSYFIAPVDPTDSGAVQAAGQRLYTFKQQVGVDGTPAAALRSLGSGAAGIQVAAPKAYRRQELAPALAAAIWPLNDNDLSEPVLGGDGIHIFERIPAATARPQLTEWLGPELQRRADAAFIDSVMVSRGLTVAADGPARLRTASAEPGTFRSEAPLVTWSGGDLSPAEARSWLAMMPAPERARLRFASDTSLRQTLGLMGRREVLFEMAVAAGTDPAASREELEPGFREQLAAVAADASEEGDATRWMRSILEGRRRFRPQPGALPAVLRDRIAVTVDEAALSAAAREAARTWQPPSERAARMP